MTLTDPGPIGPQGDEEGEMAVDWTPEKDNFVGEDGLVYGVPYAGKDGVVIMPDMGRVKATNGEYGYIAIDEIDSAIYNGATTNTEREQVVVDNADLEARALQQAFTAYFGVEALGYEAAYDCITEIRYEDGKRKASATMENDTTVELAAAIAEGMVAPEKVISILDDGTSTLSRSTNVEAIDVSTIAESEINITEDIFEEIFKNASQQMMVSISVFAEDGRTVVGEYEFVRI